MKFLSNSTQEVTLIPGRDYAVFAAGSFGGGTITLTLADSTLAVTLPMPEYGSIEDNTSFIFTAPSPRLLVALSGASSASLVVDCVLCPFGS